MDLQQLRYFLAVVEHGNFTRAAAAIGRSQQALSKGIGTLEKQLGEHLFLRGTRQARLTRAGRLLLEHARTVDVAVARFEDRLADMQTGAQGRVHIGAGPSCAGSLVAPAVLALRRQWPAIRVQVSGGIAPQLLPQLVAGKLDLVVSLHTLGGADTPDARIHARTLAHDDYRVLAAADHPLARAKAIEPSRLLDQPWIFGQRLGAVEQAFAAVFRDAGLEPPGHTMETDSLELLRAMVGDGGYLTLLPSRLAREQLRSRQWCQLDAPGFLWRRPVMLYSRANDPQSAPLARLQQALRDAAQ